MKLFISADIEGVTGVTTWEETESGNRGYEEACRQMTLEVNAACEAAIEAGYEVYIKDGHGDALNLDLSMLPKQIHLIRGWGSSPAEMMEGIDSTFDAFACIGYHAPAGSDASPLAHTISHEDFNWMKVNGALASEFTMNALWAAEDNVPPVFISGDAGICAMAKEEYPDIVTVVTKTCTGNSTSNIHPEAAVKQIKDGVAKALKNPLPAVSLKDEYTLEISFKEHSAAKNASWYPNAQRTDVCTVSYTGKTPKEVMTARMFMTGI